MSALTESAAWRALTTLAEADPATTTSARFERDPGRAARYSAEACGLYLDYSKQRLGDDALAALLALAEQQQMPGWIARMFAGEAINATEGRAVGHVALRGAASVMDGQPVTAKVDSELARIYAFADAVRSGDWRGASGDKITDVVNIGIGGSDFGPRMIWDALAEIAALPRAHYVSNVDGAQLGATLRWLDPATTLFVVTSKTFTTQETMANANAARRWLTDKLGDAAVSRHFAGVSTARATTEAFGIDPANVFEFWDWVGGRYSLWSAVGLSAVIALGPTRFQQLLAGAKAMDEHFRDAPLKQNLPVLMALIAVWNNNFLGAASQVVAPYAQRLHRFVGWLQQLEMESNGKRVDREGRTVDYPTTPIVWGDVGSNAQHAFFQLLHQGPALNPVDFILPIEAIHGYPEQQQLLIANCLAQSAALMRGKTADQVRDELVTQGLSGEALEAAIPHRVFTGNRPSNTLLLPRLDPYHLGALCALYEHRTFALSVLWNINAFDQWGVELGKQLAQEVVAAQADPAKAAALDPSTRLLLERIHAN
ncbi:glucose-6-phosphate isomerase [Nevskia sp.]|uniref:glucose-6-phosphate isomerase n=1 Tax=Nevskia sp. TaxID=1929292 RepID=UPI0025FFB465|nr:glucose-6-phosphate isomerase [Nevskia sp.]